jgi:hypothetical protein
VWPEVEAMYKQSALQGGINKIKNAARLLPEI